MDKNKVDVLIGGRVYTIIGTESEEHIQKVARYLDKKMINITESDFSRTLSANMKLILTSLNVANDLFIELKKNEELEEEISKLNKRIDEANATIELYRHELGKIQEENILLSEKIGEQQLNYTYISQENDRKADEQAKLADEIEKIRNYNFELKVANESLSKELAETKQEFDDFISTFDTSGNSAVNIRRIK